MQDTITGNIIIHYIDGTEMKVEYVRQEESSSIATRIEKAIESNELLIELEDRLLVIPLNSLKYIEVVPPPQKLPNFTIRNARLT